MRWRALLGALVAALPPTPEAELYLQGCLLYGTRFAPSAEDRGSTFVVNVSNTYDCQTACLREARCKYFSYRAQAGACWFSSTSSHAAQEDGFVSGPARCTGEWGARGPCAALPGPGFPGATADESCRAWPLHFVPLKLQCWPHGGSTSRDLLPCGDGAVEILEDTTSGWPGKCLGLTQVALPPGLLCKQRCEQDLMCPSWQEVDEGSNRTSCWLGLGYDCWDATRALTVRSAQRLMRGSFRVLLSLAGYEVDDLRNVFGTGTFGRNLPVAMTVCKRACLSLLSCEVWQFSSSTGCWVNDPHFRNISYPPTTATFRQGTDAGKTVVAGEYIQRLCKAGVALPAPRAAGPAVAAVNRDRPLVPGVVAAPTAGAAVRPTEAGPMARLQDVFVPTSTTTSSSTSAAALEFERRAPSTAPSDGDVLLSDWWWIAALIIVPCCLGLAAVPFVCFERSPGDETSKRDVQLFDCHCKDREADHESDDDTTDAVIDSWQPAGLDVYASLPGAPGARAVSLDGPRGTSMMQWGEVTSPTVPYQELDLVRVTEHGVEITPLNGPPPPGVPIMSPVPN